jgi:hypothetical protein
MIHSVIRTLSLVTLLTVLSAVSAQSVTIGGSVTIGQPQRVARYDYSPTRYTPRYVVETRPARYNNYRYNDYRYNDYRYTTRYDYRYDTPRTEGVIYDTGRDYAYDRVRTVYYTDPYYERVYSNTYHAPNRDGAIIRIQIHP